MLGLKRENADPVPEKSGKPYHIFKYKKQQFTKLSRHNFMMLLSQVPGEEESV